MGAPRQHALLALLLLSEGRQVSSDAIVSALWGPNAPRSAFLTTRSYVSRLRQVLLRQDAAEPEIRSVGGGYQICVDPTQVDALSFRETVAAARAARDRGRLDDATGLYRTALAMWRGPALGGLQGAFFDARRTWLEEQRRAASHALWELEIEQGHCEEAVADLTEATTANPFDEGLWQLLMIAFTRADRRADALSAYQQVSSLLDSELGLEPGPGLRSARAQIISGQLRTAPRPAAYVRAVA
ncbi:BTAD domain-containing putative transcriptional regulator [Kribbella sp. NPDC051587]|uniref:AfsR/SARP family transcriptional regulator n=1 Tax=Kribbella sp. NPDC051587 TaxID=3364119 RepID=UPI00379B67A6